MGVQRESEVSLALGVSGEAGTLPSEWRSNGHPFEWCWSGSMPGSATGRGDATGARSGPPCQEAWYYHALLAGPPNSQIAPNPPVNLNRAIQTQLTPTRDPAPKIFARDPNTISENSSNRISDISCKPASLAQSFRYTTCISLWYDGLEGGPNGYTHNQPGIPGQGRQP